MTQPISVTYDFTFKAMNLIDYIAKVKDVFGISKILIDSNTLMLNIESEDADGCIEYLNNFTNAIDVGVLTNKKLLKITEEYQKLARRFAAENSIAMAQLNYTAEQKAAFVRNAVDMFEPIKHEMDMYSYYSIWTMFDEIDRDEIITDERVNSMKAELQAIIFG